MIQIENIDNMELMARYQDKYFDIGIVDPEYGLNFSKYNRTNKAHNGERVKANKYKNSDWDANPAGATYFKELQRVTKQQIIWGGNYFLDHLGNSKAMICWYKHQPVDNFSDCEYAWVSFNKPAKVFDFPYYGNVEGKTSASEKFHPTQKPIALYKWLLKNYANPGDKILDTHLGSGSIAIACEEMGFDLTACEIDKDYYDAALNRLENYRKQLRLL